MASNLAPNYFILLSFLFSLSFVTSIKAQLETLPRATVKDVEAGMTHIHFFFHDIVSGKNPTAITITQPVSGSMTTFGMMNMMDDKLTEGPDTSSKEVGRAQGLYASSCLGELGFLQVYKPLLIQVKLITEIFIITREKVIIDNPRFIIHIGQSVFVPN